MDPKLLAYNPETEGFESSGVKLSGTALSENSNTSFLRESTELELAARLLEVTHESELDEFLGDLLRKVTEAGGQFIGSPVGQSLVALLKGTAKQAVPNIARAATSQKWRAGGLRFGEQLTTSAEATFGLELEGLSREDQEFEVAKAFVRFAEESVKKAATPSLSVEPEAIARDAILQASQRYAPGLLRSITKQHMQIKTQSDSPPQSGRWFRDGPIIAVTW